MGRLTDRYAPLGPLVTEPSVTLVAQARYHLLELDRLAAALGRYGVRSQIVVPVIGWKPLHSMRPTVRRTRETVLSSGREPGPPLALRELLDGASAVVVMNDWGVPRQLVEEAGNAGRPTFGLVEGVQDYHDIDTGLARRAYQRVDHVFTLGAAGSRALGVDRCTAVGSERLRHLWQSEPGEVGSSVLINSNFTYGVLVDARREWVDGVVTAATNTGWQWVLSRHSAERGRTRHRPSSRSFDELLLEAGFLITRFSTVALDALAVGIELVFYNPHGEQEPTFQAGRDGFAVSRSVDALERVLRDGPRSREVVREATAEFLHDQVLLDAATTPAERVAAVISDRIG